MNFDVESPLIRAWQHGLNQYVPVFRGEELLAESGRPEPSLHNLRKITEQLDVLNLLVGPGGQILVTFTTGETYLAAGFAAGKADRKTKAFAAFCSEIGKGTPQECLLFLSTLDSSLQDPIDFSGIRTGLRVVG